MMSDASQNRTEEEVKNIRTTSEPDSENVTLYQLVSHAERSGYEQDNSASSTQSDTTQLHRRHRTDTKSTPNTTTELFSGGTSLCYASATKEDKLDFNDKFQIDDLLNIHYIGYQCNEVVGHGGFGTIYRIDPADPSLTSMALKRMFHSSQSQSEIFFWNQLEDPNVVKLVCDFQTEDYDYCIMPFFDSGDLWIRVVHGSLFLDPTRPDPPKRWPDPTRPTIADKKSDPTRPDPRPDPSPICIVFNWIIVFIN